MSTSARLPAAGAALAAAALVGLSPLAAPSIRARRRIPRPERAMECATRVAGANSTKVERYS